LQDLCDQDQVPQAARPEVPPRFLSGLSVEQLEALAAELGEKPYRGRQLFEQIHARLVLDFDEMAPLPGSFRTRLAETGWKVHALAVAATRRSCDGTIKLALATHDSLLIESVLIPMEEGQATQCLSSQVGCPLKCTICMTGRIGFKRNLLPAEIVDQHLLAARHHPDLPVRNLVFMGMGEPLLNLSHVAAGIRLLQEERGRSISYRRITISTAGIIPGLEALPGHADCLLAVSLNAPNQELRAQLMPISRQYPLDRLMATLEAYPLKPRQRITFEYVLLPGVNDSPAHARELVRLLSHIRCKVNLIPYNPFPGSPYGRPEEGLVERFGQLLADKQMTVTIRRSKGADIEAACGQLAGGR
jgi:23S rRNA (adenine2503-C2)-methyltransferase